jgi:putative peptidoglycan lipid II flippase
VGLAAVQVNIFVSTVFASHEPGAVSWLQYAFRILYLPIGVFGVAVGTVATTGLARRAAAEDMEGLRETLGRSLSLVAFLTIPATVGLMVLGRPIVRLLFERGRFHAADTENTAAALALFSIGLVAFTGVKVLAPAFYALGRPRVPLLASAGAVAANLVVIALLHARLGYRAIALGIALGSLLNAAVLAGAFERSVGGLLTRPLAGRVLRMALAAGLMAPAAWLSARFIASRVGTHGLAAQALGGLGPVTIGVVVYFAARFLPPPARGQALTVGPHETGDRERRPMTHGLGTSPGPPSTYGGRRRRGGPMVRGWTGGVGAVRSFAGRCRERTGFVEPPARGEIRPAAPVP